MNLSTSYTHFENITECYEDMLPRGSLVLVFPPIREKFPKTDYLYLLYSDLLEQSPAPYSLKSINALKHLLLPFLALRHRGKVALHYHWLEFQDLKSLLAFPYKFLWFSLFSALGTPIIWTVHNLEPHDRKWLGPHRWLHRSMAKRAQRLHIHSEALLERTSNYLDIPLDSTKWCVVPHPSFPADIKDRSTAIDELNRRYSCTIPEDATILLLFGNISAYKGILEFVELFIEAVEAGISRDTIHVIIAGPVKKGQETYHQQITTAITQLPQYFSHLPHFFPEEEYPFLLSASDYCLFNYQNIHSSGGLMMALSYSRKVIAPDIGIFSSHRNDSRVQLFTGKDELRQIIDRLHSSTHSTRHE
ncbi:MAG: hypothetical protein O3C06_08200 [Bacteroidetes bacterium]|nr:hypothetical protein [Balneolaceae bacterium]MBL6916897.1 hypothetical protein [Balneolaceae bacterium]MDA0735968.1 hypothetical protein [Bacteroidota bacterium]MDA1126916.1 hypothetical protein [Bacteroidota bacterium]